MLDGFSSTHGVSKVARFANTNRKKLTPEAFCSVRKFLQVVSICTSSLIIWSTIVNLKCSMRYCRGRPCIKWVLLTVFLEIHWLTEWKVVSITVPNQTKKYFFCQVKKINASGVSTAEIFLRIKKVIQQ